MNNDMISSIVIDVIEHRIIKLIITYMATWFRLMHDALLFSLNNQYKDKNCNIKWLEVI